MLPIFDISSEIDIFEFSDSKITTFEILHAKSPIRSRSLLILRTAIIYLKSIATG